MKQKSTSEIVEEIYERLKKSSCHIWQSPQSFGQKHVVDWSDVEAIFKDVRRKNKMDAVKNE
jgi:predicted CopG family antitoxin